MQVLFTEDDNDIIGAFLTAGHKPLSWNYNETLGLVLIMSAPKSNQ